MDCTICFNNNDNFVIFNDCCTFRLCKDCSQKVNKCPICRKERASSKYFKNVLVYGACGSGKTVYIKNFVKNYYKLCRKYIYVFSPLSEYDDIEYINKIQMTKDVIDNISIIDLQDSLVIIEDIDLRDFKKNRKILEIVNNILEQGKHHNISCIVSDYCSWDPIRQFYKFDECIKLPRQRQLY